MDVATAAAIVKSATKVTPKGKECVKVVVRCRPLFGRELAQNCQSIITIDAEAGVVIIRNPNDNDNEKSFTFDSAYDENSNQQQVYDESAYPLVESIFEGYNGTIFAYGQTGCGKTHTMQGSADDPGIIPHAFDHFFEFIAANQHNREFMVHVSYLEIYNEEIRDLLGVDHKQALALKETPDTGVYVKDLTEIAVGTTEEIYQIMEKGFKNRTVGSTLMNAGSSRSHSIFTVMIEISDPESGENGQEKLLSGKLNLVDLAGSERQSKTGASGSRLKEGCKINMSLSALGNVIAALVDGKGKHIPYRDSKLTRLLKDSLGGNTKTVMVAAISPADYNYDETMSTLRYANRAKNIKNKPTVNEDPKEAKLREYRDEIENLRQQLLSQSQLSSPAVSPDENMNNNDPGQHQEEENAALKEMNAQILTQQNQMNQALEQTTKEIESHKREKEELLQKLQQFQSHVLGRSSSSLNALAISAAVPAISPKASTNKTKQEEHEEASEREGLVSENPDQFKKEQMILAEAMEAERVALAQQKAEVRRAQIKLKAKKKKEAQLRRAKEILELEKQMMEDELKSTQAEAQANMKVSKKKNTKYKLKLEHARQEIADLNHEFQVERENLLDHMREQRQEVKLYEQLVECFLLPEEIAKVWEKARWREEDEAWTLPRFQKRRDCATLALPQLGASTVEGVVSHLDSIEGGMEIHPKDDLEQLQPYLPPSSSSSEKIRRSSTAKKRQSSSRQSSTDSPPASLTSGADISTTMPPLAFHSSSSPHDDENDADRSRTTTKKKERRKKEKAKKERRKQQHAAAVVNDQGESTGSENYDDDEWNEEEEEEEQEEGEEHVRFEPVKQPQDKSETLGDDDPDFPVKEAREKKKSKKHKKKAKRYAVADPGWKMPELVGPTLPSTTS